MILLLAATIATSTPSPVPKSPAPVVHHARPNALAILGSVVRLYIDLRPLLGQRAHIVLHKTPPQR